ncbi:MAG: Glu/Leu/Phe/Val dehydrogenase [Dehalococcoidia bacterium]|nr:Glu/Leu/Phe/Val dehydrogenase [Dehalococcoidia bacterium]
MNVFDYMGKYDFEQVVMCSDTGAGLRAIIAIHDTTLGPALGGTRMRSYPSEDDAMKDVLRLARGMTYKAAAAGLNLGGGNALIIGDPRKDKSEALLRSLGKYVGSLGGRYITTQDMGTTVDDMEHIAAETEFVAGLPVSVGGSGDQSPITAFGVLRAMEACAKNVFGSGSLKGKVVAVQGLGKVGSALARLLYQEGAEIVATDANESSTKGAIRQFRATIVKPDEIFDVECDVFSPCASGGVLNRDTIARLKAKIVAGGANNQLADEECAGLLAGKRILYAPDYVANSGSVIQLASELAGHGIEGAKQRVARIYDTVEAVIARAEAEHVNTAQASDRIVEERIQSIRRTKKIYR